MIKSVKITRSDVSIHAFRGEGDPLRARFVEQRRVSIHAFRGEGDAIDHLVLLPTPVSIHAFRGEGDTPTKTLLPHLQAFQSTPSGGKATQRGETFR